MSILNGKPWKHANARIDPEIYGPHGADRQPWISFLHSYGRISESVFRSERLNYDRHAGPAHELSQPQFFLNALLFRPLRHGPRPTAKTDTLGLAALAKNVEGTK